MRKIQSASFFLMLSQWMIMLGFLVSVPLLDAAIANPKTTWQSVFLNWFSQEPKDRGKGGNSGGRPIGTLCLITPGVDTVLWTTKPLFVWQGSYDVIGVRPKGDYPILWGEIAPAQNQSVKRLSYPNQPLEPGKTYEWVFFVDENRRSPLNPVAFRVMGAKERAAIDKDLQALETRLKSQKVTQEAIALQRTNYFAEQGLRADALQEIYSVKQPSAKLKQVMRDIEKQVCQSQE
jgi:Domain of Unknown Function (DUF928)